MEIMKELIDNDAINPLYLDKKSRELYYKIVGGERETEISDSDEDSHSDKPLRYTDDMHSYDEDEGELETYTGKLYYNVYVSEDSETILEISDMADGLRDSDFEKFGVKFEKDFPEYRIAELMESVFEVMYTDTWDFVDLDELREKLESNPDYELGEW